MKRLLAGLVIGVFTIVTFVTACSKSQSEQGTERPIVLVSIAPQKYFLEQVAGKDSFTIVVIVPEGQSPHSYEPTPSQLASMSKAALWFTTGVEFETVLIPKLTAIAPGLTIIDTTAGIQYRNIEAHDHDHDAENEDAHEEDQDNHTDEGKDPHVWMGLSNVQTQSLTMSNALAERWPERRDMFSFNWMQFSERITALKKELVNKLANNQGSPVFVYHPAFGYLLDELGLKQVPVEIDGKEPGPKQLETVITAMQEARASVLFVQKQFPVTAAEKIANIAGAQVAELDPLAYDWEVSLHAIADALTAALK